MSDLITTEPISGWISSLNVGATPPMTFERVGAGQSNLTFLVTDATGKQWILRRPPLGKLLASAHDVAREYRILSGLQNTGVPVPRVHGLCDDPQVTDAPIVLMDYIDGRVVGSLESAGEIPAEIRGKLADSLTSALASIHAVDLQHAGLHDLASHASYAERQLRRWHRQWENSRTRDIPKVDELEARLRAHMPEQNEVSLVHGDFHLMNVIADPLHGSVLAVLDWELSTLGDPLADLGGLMAYWSQADDAIVSGFAGSTLPGFPTRSELVEDYARKTGRDVTSIGFWYVLGLWKTAIIAEGVMRRSRDEPRNTAVTGAIDKDVIDKRLQRASLEADAYGL